MRSAFLSPPLLLPMPLLLLPLPPPPVVTALTARLLATELTEEPRESGLMPLNPELLLIPPKPPPETTKEARCLGPGPKEGE